jgi:hypothetical protein
MYFFFLMKLLFHFWNCIPKRRTNEHNSDYDVRIKILPDIQRISNILVVHCLFSPVCVCLRLFFWKKKKHITERKSRYLSMTYIKCVKTSSLIRERERKKKHNNLLRWMQKKLIVIVTIHIVWFTCRYFYKKRKTSVLILCCLIDFTFIKNYFIVIFIFFSIGIYTNLELTKNTLNLKNILKKKQNLH